ncbi:monovalent cation/H(+) antiporter subunit G [Methylocystis sp. IM3]|jgi:multicomponent Na+:H+ antiporter subunit G|uniref:cation:proton antiporter n=1 Tax=unclassified Methylocystis TaxID=2625913 RepID=UPI000FAB6C12|nr:MAG: monovalent cation/H(+) antiporter subunit G [Hyphomicrobiales bacterium]
MKPMIDVFSVVCVSGGVFFFLAGAVALLRFPDTLTRLHALTKADNLGLGLVVLGLAPQAESFFAALKLCLVWVVAQLAGTTLSQLIGRLAKEKTSQI